MNATVALVAKRDQVLLGILTGVTTESFRRRTSRLEIDPHPWHLQPSRRST